MLFTLIENLGYRQFCTLANLAGTFRWMFFHRVQRRRVCGPFVREYNPVASANWRGREKVTVPTAQAERSAPR
jgi:hypothetical protein